MMLPMLRGTSQDQVSSNQANKLSLSVVYTKEFFSHSVAIDGMSYVCQPVNKLINLLLFSRPFLQMILFDSYIFAFH